MRIKQPEFEIQCGKNIHILERESIKMAREGWYPVGGVGRRGHDWIQVFVREQNGETDGSES